VNVVQIYTRNRRNKCYTHHGKHIEVCNKQELVCSDTIRNRRTY